MKKLLYGATLTKLDILFIIFILALLIQDISIILTNLIDMIINSIPEYSTICQMSSNTSANTTNTQIIHSDEGWAQGIKSIFIYGTGAMRFHLLRAGGTPMQRNFILASTIAADNAAAALRNAINNPEYVEKHIGTWANIFKGTNASTLEINVLKDTETAEKLSQVSSCFTDNNEDKITNFVLEYLKPILEPVSVDYSNEVLATQIYGISILLFMLSVLIMILLLGFLLNIIILVYSDKLMSLFTNKYIRWYIALNKKLIGIEICFLGTSLIYFMYNLSAGIHFIATHPITF